MYATGSGSCTLWCLQLVATVVLLYCLMSAAGSDSGTVVLLMSASCSDSCTVVTVWCLQMVATVVLP